MNRLQTYENLHEVVHNGQTVGMLSYSDKDEMVSILQNYAINGKIACARLRRVADELGVPSRSLGKIAKEYNIKIIACELGCF